MEIPNGTLDKFHLGVSADGQTCMMVFVDEDQRTIRCVADFSEFNAFIANLNRAAAEMSRRRQDEGDEEGEQGPACGTLNVAFAEFQLEPDRRLHRRRAGRRCRPDRRHPHGARGRLPAHQGDADGRSSREQLLEIEGTSKKNASGFRRRFRLVSGRA